MDVVLVSTSLVEVSGSVVVEGALDDDFVVCEVVVGATVVVTGASVEPFRDKERKISHKELSFRAVTKHRR